MKASTLHASTLDIAGYWIAFPWYGDHEPERGEGIWVRVVTPELDPPTSKAEADQLYEETEEVVSRVAYWVSAWLPPAGYATHARVDGPMEVESLIGADVTTQPWFGAATLELRGRHYDPDVSKEIILRAVDDPKFDLLLGLKASLNWGTRKEQLVDAWRALELVSGEKGKVDLLAAWAVRFANNLNAAQPAESWSTDHDYWKDALDLRSRTAHADKLDQRDGGPPITLAHPLTRDERASVRRLVLLAQRAADSFFAAELSGYTPDGVAALP